MRSLFGCKRGSSALTLLVFLAAFFAVFALVSDIARVYAVKVAARHALNLSLRAASGQLDPDLLANPESPQAYILPQQAGEVFDATLRENLKLDRWGNPLAGSVAGGPVEVSFFRVVNDVPFTYNWDGYSETVARPAVVGIIRVPVELGFFARAASGAPDRLVLTIHSTVGPEVIAGR